MVLALACGEQVRNARQAQSSGTFAFTFSPRGPSPYVAERPRTGSVTSALKCWDRAEPLGYVPDILEEVTLHVGLLINK